MPCRPLPIPQLGLHSIAVIGLSVTNALGAASWSSGAPNPVSPWMPNPAFPADEHSNATGVNWYKQAWELYEPDCKDSIVFAWGDAINKDLDEHRMWSLTPGSFDGVHGRVCADVASVRDALRLGSRQWPHRPLNAATTPEEDLQLERLASVFVPHGCDIPFLSPAEACATAAKYSTVLILGDSITRHHVSGLFSAWSGDFVHGALPRFLDVIPIFPFAEVEPFRFLYEVVTNSSNEVDFKFLCMDDPRPILVVIQGGAHLQSDANATARVLFDPVVAGLRYVEKRCPIRTALHIVWVGMDSQSRMLDVKYPHQSRENAVIFNEQMRERAEAAGVIPLEFSEVARNAMTSDGLHFLSDVNLYKAQVLLHVMNLLHPDQQEDSEGAVPLAEL